MTKSKRDQNQADRQAVLEMDRRRFLLNMASAGLASSALMQSSLLRAEILQPDGAGVNNNFMLYIHFGSIGQDTGITQLPDAKLIPKGFFRQGTSEGSFNPAVMDLYKSGSMVYNNYSKVLDAVGDHLCHATFRSDELDHSQAFYRQSTGGRSESANPSWVSGMAQAFLGSDAGASATVSGNMAPKLARSTPGVSHLQASSVASFISSFTDSGNVPKDAAAKAFWDANQQVNGGSDNARTISNLSSIPAYLSNLVKGAPELTASSPVVLDAAAAITNANANALVLREMDDGPNIVTPIDTVIMTDHGLTAPPDITGLLQLAYCLAATGKAKGLSINISGHDSHGGGGSVFSARAAAKVYAQIVLFWQQVKAAGLAQNVMVVMSHDFSRGAYDAKIPGPTTSVLYRGNNVNIQSPGTGHSTIANMYILNGNVAPRSRIGGVGDFQTPMGSKSFAGIPDANVKSYSSMDVFGSLIMRCYPKLFPNADAVKSRWPLFNSPIDFVIS